MRQGRLFLSANPGQKVSQTQAPINGERRRRGVAREPRPAWKEGNRAVMDQRGGGGRPGRRRPDRYVETAPGMMVRWRKRSGLGIGALGSVPPTLIVCLSAAWATSPGWVIQSGDPEVNPPPRPGHGASANRPLPVLWTARLNSASRYHALGRGGYGSTDNATQGSWTWYACGRSGDARGRYRNCQTPH